MQTLIALEGASWWSSMGILVIALVICCLVMMFTMRMGMGRKSRNQNTQSNRTEGEEPGTKKS